MGTLEYSRMKVPFPNIGGELFRVKWTKISKGDEVGMVS